jgi:ribosomal protein L19E
VAYYLFCCCLCSTNRNDEESEKETFISQFRSTLKTLKKKRNVDSEVFSVMVQLYKTKQHALTNLTKVRLNPNLAAGQDA